MIQLTLSPLDAKHARSLESWQAAIDSIRDYPRRVEEGKAKFKSRNVKSNRTFEHVKAVLTHMCQGARRCAYCEDSVADQVEHIKPKDLYPELVFAWDNYVYACGPCNGPKNSQYAVLGRQPLKVIEVGRKKGDPILPPAAGDAALINPRIEDPQRFLFLDLLNTFAFVPRDDPGVTAADKRRAEYTIKVLRLNARDYLIKARRTAFGTYRARLLEYVVAKKKRASQAMLDLHRDELLQVGHLTVWREMQRQHLLFPPLRELFQAAPEALQWR